MADVKIAYAADVAMTLTFASLASSTTAGRESTVVDNASNKYLDALVTVKFTLQAGTIGALRSVLLLAYASIDQGTTYSEVATGSNAAITLRDPSALPILGEVPTPTQSLAYKSSAFSVAQCFGGVLPERWGVVVLNASGIAFSATEGDGALTYAGVYQTVA